MAYLVWRPVVTWHLDKLQVQKLLQCKGQVVCPKGLNGGLEALLFDFKELPLCDVGTTDEPTQDLPLIEVNLNGMAPEALPSTRAEDPLSLKGTDPAICDLMANSLQAFPHVVMPENIPSIIQVSHSPSLPTMLRSLEVASISPSPQSQTPSRANTANDAQATEAIKEVEVYCVAAVKEAETCHVTVIKEAEAHQAIHACTLEKSHRESMLELEHEVIAEEGQDCQVFLEPCGAVL